MTEGAPPETVVAASAEQLAQDAAQRTITTLGAALRARPLAHLAVTGGGILEAVLSALPGATGADPIDWSRVHVWWGDERYVPADSSDRNDLPARAKAFDLLGPAHLHPMPASDAGYVDLQAAADAYAAELQSYVPGENAGELVPRFDTVLLGIGPDGHCASLFPGHPGLQVLDTSVVAVHDSPKPPPDRLSLSFTALNAANEIWVIASGEGKADAVARALGGAPREQVPSAGVRGRQRTLWLLDRDAATQLPPG